jgi:hypothetical protein
MGRPQGRSGRVWKISPPPGFDPRTGQPVVSRYTDWAIAAHIVTVVARRKVWRTVAYRKWKNDVGQIKINTLYITVTEDIMNLT